MAALRRFNPDLVLHTAALTNMDGCETHPALAHRLNVDATQHVATATQEFGAKLVHFSTVHLFDGTESWTTEEHMPNPLSVYSRTKLKGEEVVLRTCSDPLVIRTDLFGWGTSFNPTLSDWVLDSLRRSRELTMFADVFATLILINDLVDLIPPLVDCDAAGVFNLAGRDRVSRYDFALNLAETFQHSKDGIRAISLEDLPLKARRAKDMSVSSEKAERFLGTRMPHLEDGLSRLKQLAFEGLPAALEDAVRGNID